MAWASIILTALKIINQIMGVVQQQKWIQSGHDQAIAEETKAILARTVAGKAIMDKINAMSDAQVDDALRGLEPK